MKRLSREILVFLRERGPKPSHYRFRGAELDDKK
jgi:hypothetical protein